MRGYGDNSLGTVRQIQVSREESVLPLHLAKTRFGGSNMPMRATSVTQFSGGGDDVVTRSHENLLSTVRGTSRCKARLREASMPSLNSQRQSNRGISRSEIIGILLVQVLVLLALLVAVVRYLEWSSDANQGRIYERDQAISV